MKPKHPSFKQIQYFVTLAKTLNYRKAADRLEITQSTLTAQIGNLEEILQLSLFERSRNGTFLSPAGRQLLEPAQQVLSAMHDFEERSYSLARGPATTFRLGVPPTLGPYLLPYVLPDLHAQYENLRLYVREDAPRQLESRLVTGEFDLIISPQTSDTTELYSMPLFKEPLKFVIPGDHPLVGNNKISPKMIAGESVLSLEEHHHFHAQVQALCKRYGAHLQRDYEGTSLDTLRQMVVMGLGVTFLPGLYIHSELHHPKALHVCELEGNPIVRQHVLMWRKQSPSRVFFRELAQQIITIIDKNLPGVVKT